jgi:hypothetical protein
MLELPPRTNTQETGYLYPEGKQIASRRDPANQTAVPKAAGAPASEPTVRSGMDLAPEEGNVAE